jgi:hypothetical protein
MLEIRIQTIYSFQKSKKTKPNHELQRNFFASLEIPNLGRYPGIKSIIKACENPKIAMSDWFITLDKIQ